MTWNHVLPRRTARLVGFAALLLGAFLSPAVGGRGVAHAQGKEYRYETDPVRLGLKSVDERDLATAQTCFDEAIANNYRVEEAHRGIGEILFLQGRYDDAKRQFEAALVGEKKVAEAHAGLGLIALREGNASAAEQAFNAALQEDDGLWRAKYGLARIAIQRGELDKAADLLKSGSKKKSVADGEQMYRVGMALLLVAQGKADEAESHALTGLSLEPSDPDVVMAVGDVYEKKGIADLAIGKFEAILADPAVVVNKGALHYRLGLLYEQKQKYADALRSYQAALAQDSTIADAYLHAGALFSSAKQYQEAAYLYYRYTQLDPNDAAGFQRLAEACIETNRFPNALEAARKAVALDSTNVESRHALARAAAAMKENDLALATYGGLSDKDLDGRDHMNLGNVYLSRSGQKEIDPSEKEDALSEARSHFQTAVEMDTTLSDAYFGLGYLDLVEKDYLTSEDNLSTAVRLSPGSAAAVLNLGIVQLQLKKFPEATASFQKAAELAPKSAQARVYLGQAYAVQERYKEAEAAYREGLAIDPANPGLLKGLGFILVSTERFAEAEATLTKATEVNPNDAGAWVLLGQSRAYQGKSASARDAYLRALAIDPDNKQAKDGMAGLPAAGATTGR